FTAFATGTSPTTQWLRSTNAGVNWDDIAGATAQVYTTPNLAQSESGTRFRAISYVACNNTYATSAVATVTLTPVTPTPAGIVVDDSFDDNSRNNEPVTSTNSVWWSATGEGTPGLDAFN